MLTPAEREVAELVTSGLTNKQIGAALYCSRYTVDSHLCAIYRKGGVTSRAALASHVSRINEDAQEGMVRQGRGKTQRADASGHVFNSLNGAIRRPPGREAG
jgi:DNA-binding CsgD family transcriptional regulator